MKMRKLPEEFLLRNVLTSPFNPEDYWLELAKGIYTIWKKGQGVSENKDIQLLIDDEEIEYNVVQLLKKYGVPVIEK